MKRGKYIRTKKHRELKRIQNLGQNNPHYGKKHTQKTKEKQKVIKLAEKNPMGGENKVVIKEHKQKGNEKDNPINRIEA